MARRQARPGDVKRAQDNYNAKRDQRWAAAHLFGRRPQLRSKHSQPGFPTIRGEVICQNCEGSTVRPRLLEAQRRTASHRSAAMSKGWNKKESTAD